ncbi:MAG: ATP-binding protein, partial [Calditrichaceae bacterium]|nr:ATP-binding protein [Calditrichaceae bacterium]
LKDFPQTELKSRLKKDKHSLTKELHTKYLPNLIEVVTQANLEKVIFLINNKVSEQMDELHDTHTIITEYSQKQDTPVFKSDKIRFKELIQFEIMTGSSGMADDYADELNIELERLKRKISNIDQVVEFNLEAAIDMLDDESSDKSDKAHEVAVSGLERALANMDDINEDLDTFINNAEIKIGYIASDLQNDIQKLGDNEHVLQLRIRLARIQTKEKITEFRNIIWKRIKAIIPKVWRILLKSLRKIRKSYQQVQQLSGLASTGNQNDYAVFDFIAAYKKNFEKLPFIYQKLFSTEPLDDRRFFIGRDTHFNKISSAFDRFLNGQPVSTAITGEKGNGKTSLVYFASQEIFAGHKIHTINFQRSVYTEESLKRHFINVFNLADGISFDELINELLKLEDRHIIILENLHNMFLRAIDGFNVLEKFLFMMSKLQNKYFWLITSGIYGWEYLDKVLHISDYFHHIIDLTSLDDKAIRELIETRHKASGYGLNFIPSTKFERNRAYRKLKTDAEKQTFLSEYFFKTLAENSNGNIKIAMQIWLSAIDHVEDEDIYVDTEFSLDQLLILNLSNDEYFTLAAFIQHEYLTVKEHAKIFHQSEDASELIINCLFKKGILDLIDNNYLINTFVYRPIIKNLRLKNILN